jgi:hypothetical protein
VMLKNFMKWVSKNYLRSEIFKIFFSKICLEKEQLKMLPDCLKSENLFFF